MGTELNLEVAKVLDRLDHEIAATPTGDSRNVLTDAVIIIRTLQGEIEELNHNLLNLQGEG